MNWNRGFFRVWIFATLFWIILVAILFRPDALMKYPGAYGHEINKTSQPIDNQSKESSLSSLVADKVLASFLGPGDKDEKHGNIVVLLQNDAPYRRLRDRLLRFAVVALIPPWALLLAGISVLWVIRGFERK